MAKVQFNALEWESKRAAECLAEGDFSHAIKIFTSEPEIGSALRKMLTEMLGPKGNSLGTGLKLGRRRGKGAIPKTKSNFWRNHELAEKVAACVDHQGLTVAQACTEVSREAGIGVGVSTIEAAYHLYRNYMSEIGIG
jgi:hypothetical protein